MLVETLCYYYLRICLPLPLYFIYVCVYFIIICTHQRTFIRTSKMYIRYNKFHVIIFFWGIYVFVLSSFVLACVCVCVCVSNYLIHTHTHTNRSFVHVCVLINLYCEKQEPETNFVSAHFFIFYACVYLCIFQPPTAIFTIPLTLHIVNQSHVIHLTLKISHKCVCKVHKISFEE